METSSFSSSVSYPFTFSEIAFLIWKLSLVINRRFVKLHKRLTSNEMTMMPRKKDDNETKEDKARLIKLAIEKIAKQQDDNLKMVQTRRNVNLKKWRIVKDKVLNRRQDNNKVKKGDIEHIRMSFLRDITSYLSNEFKDFQRYSPAPKAKAKSSKDISNIFTKTLCEKLNKEELMDVEIPKYNVIEEKQEMKEDKKERKVELPREEIAFNIKKKDALGKIHQD